MKRIQREKEKKNTILKKQVKTTLNTIPRKSVHNLLKRSGLNPSKASKELQQSLLFADVLSNEIKQTVLERKSTIESIRRVASGDILRRCRLIHFAASDKQITIDENFQLLHQKSLN